MKIHKACSYVNLPWLIYGEGEMEGQPETPQSEETFCYDKRTQEASKLLLFYPENSLDIPEDAAFKPRTIVKNNYLVDWEQPDNDENPIIVLVEP